jgi:chemotaxis protein MotB
MLRVRKLDDDEKTDRWLVSYADFITLLFAFFVVMYSISQVNEGKYRVLSESLLTAFDASGKRSPSQEFNPIDLSHNTTTILPEQSTEVVDSSEQHSVAEDEVPENYATPKEFERIEQQLNTQLDDLIKKDLVTIKKSRDWLEIDLRSALLFESGSERLSSNARLVLEEIANTLKSNQHQITVRGHTDNMPIETIRFRSNWELSAARAVSVVRLLQQIGIAPQRLAAQGLGEYQPIASNDTAEGRAKNRRVTIAVSRYKAAAPSLASSQEPLDNELSAKSETRLQSELEKHDAQSSVSEEMTEPQYEIIRLPEGGLIIRGKKLPEQGKPEDK